MLPDVVSPDFLARTQDQQSLDQIAQFPHVPRKPVRGERRERGLGEAAGSLAMA